MLNFKGNRIGFQKCLESFLFLNVFYGLCQGALKPAATTEGAKWPINLYEGNWVEFEQGLDLANAIQGGQPYGRSITNICRMKSSDGSLLVGKEAWELCYFPEGSFESPHNENFEVLFFDKTDLAWLEISQHGVLPSDPVAGGYRESDKLPYLVCRYRLRGQVYCNPGNEECCRVNRENVEKIQNSSDYESVSGVYVNGYYDTEVRACIVGWGHCSFKSNNAEFEILSKNISVPTTDPVPSKWPFKPFGRQHSNLTMYYEPIVTFNHLNGSFLKSTHEVLQEAARAFLYRASKSKSTAASSLSLDLKLSSSSFSEMIINIEEFLEKNTKESYMDIETRQHYFKLYESDSTIDLSDVSAKLLAVCERILRILNLENDIPFEQAKLEVVPAIEVMDEIFFKLKADSSIFLKNPELTSSHFLIYVQLHELLCKIAPSYIPTYNETSSEKLMDIGWLVLTFSTILTHKRALSIYERKADSHDRIYGDFNEFVKLGYCYSNDNVCKEKGFKMVIDPMDKQNRPKRNPGFYAFKKYNGINDYRNQLLDVYSEFFKNFIPASVIQVEREVMHNSGNVAAACEDVSGITNAECLQVFNICEGVECENRDLCFQEDHNIIRWCLNQKTDDVRDENDANTRSNGLSCNYEFPLDRSNSNCGDDAQNITKTDCEMKGCCYDPFFISQTSATENQTIYQCFNKLATFSP